MDKVTLDYKTHKAMDEAKNTETNPNDQYLQLITEKALANIKQQLRDIRKERKMSARTVGEKCGMIQQQVSRIEGGKNNFTFGQLALICNALDVDIVLVPRGKIYIYKDGEQYDSPFATSADARERLMAIADSIANNLEADLKWYEGSEVAEARKKNPTEENKALYEAIVTDELGDGYYWDYKLRNKVVPFLTTKMDSFEYKGSKYEIRKG